MLPCCFRQKTTSWLIAVGFLVYACGTVSAQANLDKRLIQKTTLTGEARTLEQLLQELCAKHKLKLEIDKASLTEEGIDSSVSISPLQVDGITLASAFNLILEPLQLTYTIDKGTLSIGTRANADKQMLTLTYPLAGLGAVDPEMLTNSLEVMCSGLWEELDGEGGKITAISPQSATILQTKSTHAEIADLLADIAAALSGKRRPPTLIERSEDLLRRNLSKPSTLSAGEMTVAQLGELLRAKLKINVVVAETALQDEGLSLDTKITLSGEKQSAGTAITTALAAPNLTAVIRHEVFYITTKAMADEMMTVQIYDSRAAKRPAEDIAAQVTQMKEVGSWEDVDGTGGAVAVFGPLVLIRQTAGAHEKLAQRLGPGK